ncbi:MAG: hypothetical protein U0326_39380 [Polyangiales bacterium]
MIPISVALDEMSGMASSSSSTSHPSSRAFGGCEHMTQRLSQRSVTSSEFERDFARYRAESSPRRGSMRTTSPVLRYA